MLFLPPTNYNQKQPFFVKLKKEDGCLYADKTYFDPARFICNSMWIKF